MAATDRGDEQVGMMEIDEEPVLNSEKLTANALSLQTKLDAMRVELVKLRAQKAALNNMDSSENHFYKEITSEELFKLTKERTKSFLNFASVQAAIRSSQATQILSEALGLHKSDEVELEPEEKAYVQELLEENREISVQLLKNQEEGTEQEIKIIEARTELAQLFCRHQELRNELGSPGLLSDSNKDKAQLKLEKELAHRDAKLNQMRLMIQKLMIGQDKFGMRFDDETNERFRSMLIRCGMKPDEFRKEAAAKARTETRLEEQATNPSQA